MRCGEGAAARSRPIPPDPARSRPILARTPPEQCLDRGARKRGLQPDPARSRPILARTLRNGVWTGVLANEGCSPIPPDPARSRPILPDPARFRHNKNGHAHPRNEKKSASSTPLGNFFSRMVTRTPETKKNLPAAPLLVNFFVRWYPLRFWEFCCFGGGLAGA